MSKKLVCAICGKRDATSSDHVPPKGIFPKPRPSNLITVPACATCNHGASGDDEQFRVYLSMQTAGHPEGEKLWKQHSMATLRHNRKLHQSVLQGMGRGEFRSKEGIYLGERPTFLFPVKVYEKVMERIVRGLFYHHYQEVLGERIRCEVSFLTSLTHEFVSLTANWPQVTIGDGVVIYRYGRAIDAPLSTAWVFEFYGVHWALVETEPTAQDERGSDMDALEAGSSET